MKQSPPSEANSRSNDKEIPRLLWKHKVHYGINSSPPMGLILSLMNQIYTLIYHLPKIHFNIILPSTPTYKNWYIPFRFPS
jgi:hypothetical protein